MARLLILLLSISVVSCTVSSLAAQDDLRVRSGLQALYTFEDGKGDIIHDQSGAGTALDLKIANMNAIHWLNGALQIQKPTFIRSLTNAQKITQFTKRTRGLSIEAWVIPANNRQDGPARVITLSGNPSSRNFTLGQDGDHYDLRLRTTTTTTNGMPSTPAPAGTASPKLTHILFTRHPNGTARIFINGKPQVTAQIKGDFGNWDDNFSLTLVNEVGGDRPWLGTLHLIAVYSRPLADLEVKQNFDAGPNAATAALLAQQKHEQFFESRIAPLFAKHCLQCHDAVNHKGKLDLSHKQNAFSGGESGKVIVPGDPKKSLLLDQIISGDMPAEGDPLTDEEKNDIHQWIQNGAVWTVDVIDQALFANHRPTEIWLQRLTVDEYIETVKQSLGVDIAKEARQQLPPDIRADGFSNTAYNLNVDLKHIETYSDLAEKIVQQMDIPGFASRFSKSRSLSTDNTMRQFVEKMGTWILRGPLDEREISIYSGIATTIASAGGTYDEAVSLTIEAMIQSPRFLYRVEHQRGDGSTWPVHDYEMASRMSYILWGAPPDKELFKAAEAGQLQQTSSVIAQIQRMLTHPLAKKQSARFITEWLHLDRLTNLRPHPQRFPLWNNALAKDMRQESIAFFQELVWQQKRPLSELFNAQFTYATPQLAEFYGLTPTGDGLVRYDLSDVPERGGILTHASTLTIGGDDASMVTRGLFVLNDVLRGAVNDPPPGLDTTPVPAAKGLSQRTIAEKRIANTSCRGCHSKFEPLAFGLEKFNGIGAFSHRDEHGNPLRANGEILFPGTARPVTYQSAGELMDLLANHTRVQETITWKLTQFALGRPLGASDVRVLNQIHQTAWKKGGTYQELMTAILTSDLIMLTQTQTK